jgi:hypothetical protein
MQQLTDLKRAQIYRVSNPSVFDLVIELALTSGVKLLVCGNRLPFYEIAYELARRVGQQYDTILKERLFFSRAETCIQLVDFLSEMQADTLPLLVTDMLARFKDEQDSQVDELFFACQLELQRLSKETLVFLSTKTYPGLERLEHVLARITRQLDEDR